MAASSLPGTGNTIFLAVLVLAVQWGDVAAVAMGDSCTVVGDCDYTGTGAACLGSPTTVCGCAAGYEVDTAGTGCQLIVTYCALPSAVSDSTSTPVSAGRQLGSQVTYTCSNGYYISGGSTGIYESTLTCTADSASEGSWGTTPSCVLIDNYCALPPAVSESTSTPPSASRQLGSQVTYTCSNGYYISGGSTTTYTSTLTCTADSASQGSWGTTPSCVLIDNYCALPPVVSDSTSTSPSASRQLGSQVTYTCSNGYYISGGSTGIYTSTRTCTADSASQGSWGTTPSCVLIDNYCALPPVVSDSSSTSPSASRQLGSQVTYACSNGYYISGGSTTTYTSTRTCTADSASQGSWGTTPSCVLIDSYCALPQVVSDSTSTPPSASRQLGSQVTYTCSNGYYISGGSTTTYTSTRTCTADSASQGSWGTTPSCVLIDSYCALPQVVSDSTSTPPSASRQLGSQVTYTCSNGYYISGGSTTTYTSTLTCTADSASQGSWGTTPSCVLIDNYCALPPVVSDSTSTPPSASRQLGSQVTYTCSNGYYISGGSTTTYTSTRTCTADSASQGSWGTTPSCVLIDNYCALPPVVSDSTSTPPSASRQLGSQVTYTCSNGYKISSTGTSTYTSTLICTAVNAASGSWGTTPSCVPIAAYCLQLTDPDHGSVSHTTNRQVGSTGSFSCDSGYDATGTTSSTCTAGGQIAGSGVWNPVLTPACTAIASYCPSLTASGNGSLTYSAGQQLGSQATFRCDNGYSPTAPTTSTCIEGGSWSVATAPPCTAISTYCGEAPSASTNSVAGTASSGREVGSTVLYTCLNGYKISETSSTYSRTLTCTASTTSNGAWSSSAPQCVPIDNYCTGRPNPIGNSNAGNPSNGQRIGSTVVYTCLNGYKISGTTLYSRTITCGAAGSTSGTWSDDPPTCVAIDNYCDAVPTANQNSEAGAPSNNRRVGSTVVYTCSTGYEIRGSSSQYTRTLTCQAGDAVSGSWSSTAPTCDAIALYCSPALAEPTYGSMSSPNGQQIGSIVTFQCDAGYETQDTTTSVCNADSSSAGRWSVTSIPTCTAIDAGLGGDCFIAENCIPNARCAGSGKCMCNDAYYDDDGADTVGGTCVLKVRVGFACPRADACLDGNAICLGSTCQCNTGFYGTPQQTCDPRRALYNTCAVSPSTPDQCIDDNAACRYVAPTYQCRCNIGYHNPESTAVCEPNKALGETCQGTTADECSDPNGSCIEGVCACNVDYYDDDFSGNEGGNCKTVDELKVTNINFVVTTTSMTVSWAAPTDRSQFVDTYQVQYSAKDGSSGPLANVEVTTTQDEITDLTPGQAYSIAIYSINKKTTSAPRTTSVTAEMATKPNVPGPVDNNNSDLDASDGSIQLRWQQPTVGFVYSYRVRVYEGGVGGVDLVSLPTSTSASFSEPLKNGFTYSVDITARSRTYDGNKQEDSETYTATIKTVVKVPQPPTDLQCADIRDVSITLSWTAPSVPNGDIVGYKIEVFAYTGGGLLNTLVYDITGAVQDLSFTVPDLSPGSYYTFKVYTVNEGYTSALSASSPSPYCATKAKLSDPPQGLAVSDVTSRGLTVAWDKPSDTFGEHLGNVAQIVTQDGICIKEYRQLCSNCVASNTVAFDDTSCSADSITSTYIAASLLTNRQTHSVTELLPDIAYTVIVRAVNTAGRGSEAKQQQRTLEEVPQKPTNLVISEVTSTSFKLSWNIPEPRPGNTTFSVAVQPVTGPAQPKAVTVQGFSTRSVVVTGLQEFWNYTVGISAETSVGPAVSDEQPQVATNQAAPGVVNGFQVVQGTPVSYQMLNVQWKIPEVLERNGLIKHYVFKSNTSNSEPDKVIAAVDDVDHMYSEAVSVTPEEYYEYKVYAVNTEDTTGSVSTLREQAPAGPPLILEAGLAEDLVVGSATASASTSTIGIDINFAFRNKEDNGRIVEHGIVLGKQSVVEEQGISVTSLADFQSMDDWNDAQSDDFTPYRATGRNWEIDLQGSEGNAQILTYEIGVETCDEDSVGFCNGPLPADTPFIVVIIACTNGGCTVSQQYGPYRTAKDGTSEVQVTDKNGLVIGLVVGIVCLLLVVITLSIIIWRTRRRNMKNKPEDAKYHMTLQSIQIQDEGYESIDTFSLDYSSIQLLDQKLGSGQFGDVWKGKLTKQGRRHTAAIKVVKDSTNQVAVSDLKTELETLKRVGTHPNIVALLGFCEHDGILYIAMEYVAGGDLLTFLRASRMKAHNVYSNARTISSLKQDKILGFALGIAKGMVHLSSKQVIHRDLAARNVLLGDNQVPKISDFGLSRTEQVYLKTTQTKLPVRWLAYESLFENSYTTKSDVWSFGVVMWEITSLGGSPFHGMKAKDITGKLLQGYRLPKPESCGEELYDLMLQCWEKDPDGRPTFEEIEQSLQYMLDDSKVYMNLTVEGTPNYANIDTEES